MPGFRATYLLIVLALAFGSGCRSTADRPSEYRIAEASFEPLPGQATQSPVPEDLEGWDWVQLTSGEWLKGEIESYNKDDLDFESDELGDLVLDWEAVNEIVTAEPFTVRFADKTTRIGILHLVGERLEMALADGRKERFERADIQRFVRGEPTAGNYWSGRLRLGLMLRQGNTDQVDNTIGLNALRRTAQSRLGLSLDSVVSNVSDVETANNQTITGKYDLFLTPRFFATPLGFDLFRDRIQNVDLRATPYAGFGYTLLDDSDREWNVDAGVGYRYVRFDSVAAGQSPEDETTTARLGTDYQHDLTSEIELEFAYGAQIALDDVGDTDQDASLLLTFEFVYDLDFTVHLVWKRIGQPEPDENMNVPDKNDVRIDVGLSWSF